MKKVLYVTVIYTTLMPQLLSKGTSLIQMIRSTMMKSSLKILMLLFFSMFPTAVMKSSLKIWIQQLLNKDISVIHCSFPSRIQSVNNCKPIDTLDFTFLSGVVVLIYQWENYQTLGLDHYLTM